LARSDGLNPSIVNLSIFNLTGRPTHPSPAEQVKVQMEYDLAGLPVLVTSRNSGTPFSPAIVDERETISPSSAGSDAPSFKLSMCFLGISRTWVGACGLMSSKARIRSFSKTFREGISPATILQKIHSLIRRPLAGNYTRPALRRNALARL